MRISDWSSDVCSSDLRRPAESARACGDPQTRARRRGTADHPADPGPERQIRPAGQLGPRTGPDRTSAVYGKSVSVRVDLGGRPRIKKNTQLNIITNIQTKQIT